jgi:deoxyribose-phosphate aldolase
MQISKIAAVIDHTLLKPDATQKDIEKLCLEAIQFGVKTVCVNSSWIPLVAEKLQGSMVLPISVVGFPLGACSIGTKLEETKIAIGDGAKEIDTVLSIGRYKGDPGDGYWRRDIEQLFGLTKNNQVPLKVIFETGFLSQADISVITKFCAELGVGFVKTSTGFGPRGASVEDVSTMKSAISSVKGSLTQIKASGGIKDYEAAVKMIEAGASRLGTSSAEFILKKSGSQNCY